jgi:FdhD protein
MRANRAPARGGVAGTASEAPQQGRVAGTASGAPQQGRVARTASGAPQQARVAGTESSVREPGVALKAVVRDGVGDLLAVEEPLEIRVDGEPLAVTMRTPGHDEELALGFLYGEGLITGVRDAGPTADLAVNTIEVSGPLDRLPASRRFYTTSSCGVCGKGALAEVAVHAPRLGPGPTVGRGMLADLPNRLVQPGFARSGGLHATGLFDGWGRLICVREDVGRHNAMDKVIGWALREGLLPLACQVLCVSGRVSFELVQKAAVAGAPIVVGVGAPTSLAVALAEDRRLTLCGFARDGRVNVYCGDARVTDEGRLEGVTDDGRVEGGRPEPAGGGAR